MSGLFSFRTPFIQLAVCCVVALATVEQILPPNVRDKLLRLRELHEPRRWCRKPPFDRPVVYAFEDWETPLKSALHAYDPLHMMEHYFQESLLTSTRWLACERAEADLFYVPLFRFRAGVSFRHIQERVHNATDGKPPPVDKLILLEHHDFGVCERDIRGFEDAIWVTSLGVRVSRSGQPCHRPGKWVVAPGNENLAHRAYWDTLDRERFEHNRANLFVFYGSTWREHGKNCYGSKARSALIDTWGGRTDRNFSVGVHTVPGQSADSEMDNSVFCGAPHGCGWGSRLTKCIVRGSIPVILQDETTLPFEPFLDYSLFAVRVATDDIIRLEAILLSIPPQKVKEMRAEVLRVAPYFIWDVTAGGQAFEGVMNTIRALQTPRQP